MLEGGTKEQFLVSGSESSQKFRKRVSSADDDDDDDEDVLSGFISPFGWLWGCKSGIRDDGDGFFTH